MNKYVIYADHAATTAVDGVVFEAMKPFLTTEYGNPSSLYNVARKSRKAVEQSRAEIASVIGASPDEVFFTACGTESDNWALKGIAFLYPGQRKRIITSSIEHHAILHTCSFLEKMGFDIVYLPVDKYGLVNPDEFERAITPDTVLASVMFANNEIGTIEPIKKLADIAHKYGVMFHTDAVQAIAHIPINVRELGVDMLSASAHKFNGPKGVGFLYKRKGVKLENFMHGGAQEKGLRAGTENVAQIVGMATALTNNIKTLEADIAHLAELRRKFLLNLDGYGLDYIINGAHDGIVGNISVSFRGKSGEMLLHRLDLKGIAVSTGSACNSKETVASHVLQAVKVPAEYIHGTLRISLGKENTIEEVNAIADAINSIIRQSV